MYYLVHACPYRPFRSIYLTIETGLEGAEQVAFRKGDSHPDWTTVQSLRLPTVLVGAAVSTFVYSAGTASCCKLRRGTARRRTLASPDAEDLLIDGIHVARLVTPATAGDHNNQQDGPEASRSRRRHCATTTAAGRPATPQPARGTAAHAEAGTRQGSR